MSSKIIVADVLQGLRGLATASIQSVVTSPPYWGLRDYGMPGQIGLEASPDEYVAKLVTVFAEIRRALRPDGTVWLNLGDCYATGAGAVGEAPGGGEQGARWRGEATRVRDSRRRDRAQVIPANRGVHQAHQAGLQSSRVAAMGPVTQPNRMPIAGLKPDLVGMPWRVAFALQAAGWWLRSDIIWSKPNPMPESVTDRPTKSHEYLFLLSQAERYFYDREAVLEPIDADTIPRLERAHSAVSVPGQPDQHGMVGARVNRFKHEGEVRIGNEAIANPNRVWDDPAAMARMLAGRNRRTVWTIATYGYPDAHFATFPTDLVVPCISAGTSERGACPECGAPWRREIRASYSNWADGNNGARSGLTTPEMKAQGVRVMSGGKRCERDVETTGWYPACRCEGLPELPVISDDLDPETLQVQEIERAVLLERARPLVTRPCLVLDPFAGAGTTLLVADRLGRDAIGIEINPAYAAMAERRIRSDGPLFADVEVLTGGDR